jgi:hypothetical protein
VGKGPFWWAYGPKRAKYNGIWAINDQCLYMVRGDCTKVFDMHNFDWSLDECVTHYETMMNGASEAEIRNAAVLKFGLFKTKATMLNKRGIPLISVKAYDFIPTSAAYPREQIIEEVCHGDDFLTCTVSYALAYAIFIGVAAVDLYGISATDDYQSQHPSIAYLLGIAQERGIKVGINRDGGSDLLQSKFHYGYLETYP